MGNLLAICIGIAVIGFAIGAGMRKSGLTPAAMMIAGLAAAAPMLLIYVKESNGSCAGGGCIGSMFAMLFLGPIAAFGTGLATYGFCLGLWRLGSKVEATAPPNLEED